MTGAPKIAARKSDFFLEFLVKTWGKWPVPMSDGTSLEMNRERRDERGAETQNFGVLSENVGVSHPEAEPRMQCVPRQSLGTRAGTGRPEEWPACSDEGRAKNQKDFGVLSRNAGELWPGSPSRGLKSRRRNVAF